MFLRWSVVVTVVLAALLTAAAIWWRPGTQASPGVPFTFERPRGYVCYWTDQPPTIDGQLEDAMWSVVPWSDDFGDIEGSVKPKPRHRTRMKMRWDDQFLYIAAELDEPHVWATLKKHDSVIFHDNDFEVFIDPDGDGVNYGELELNAFNTTWDLLLSRAYRGGGPAIVQWEIHGLKTAVHVHGTINDPSDTDRGWTIEIAWPWANLRDLGSIPIPPAEGSQMRINFSRVEWDVDIVDGKYVKTPKRPEHNWVWSPQHAIDMHRPNWWGYLQFTKKRVGAEVVRPDPTFAGRALLQTMHDAQNEFVQKHGRFARSLAELKFPDYRHDALSGITMESTTHLFEGGVTVKTPDGPKRIYVRNDLHTQVEGERK